MTTIIEQSPQLVEPLEEQRDRQIAIVRNLQVRGLEHTDALYTAMQLQGQYGQQQNWSQEVIDDSHESLWSYLNQEPSVEIHHMWLESYARQARTARQAKDRPAYDTALANAEDVLANLARQKNWDEETIGRQQAGMWHFIGSPSKPAVVTLAETVPVTTPAETSPSKTGRLQRITGWIGGIGLASWIALQNRSVAADQQPDPDATPQPLVVAPLAAEVGTATAAEEPNKKRKWGALAAKTALSALAVGVLVDSYLASQGHGIGLRDMGIDIGHNHHPSSLIPNHHHNPNSSSSTQPTPSPTNPPSGNGNGGGTQQPGNSTAGTKGHRLVREHLHFYGDTVDRHIRHFLDHKLGGHATDQQVLTKERKTLKLDHLTFVQARHLRVGFGFLVKKPR